MAMDAMAPWDATRWFDLPTESIFAFAMNQTLILAPFEIRRVALFIGVPASSAGINVSIGLGAGPLSGIAVTPNQPLVLTFASHGPLVQQTVQAFSSSNQNVTFWQLLLRDWP